MADVLSGDVSLRTGRDDLTVVLLNCDETTALTDLLELLSLPPLADEDFTILDELTNMLLALAKDDAIAEMRFIERNQCDDDD